MRPTYADVVYLCDQTVNGGVGKSSCSLTWMETVHGGVALVCAFVVGSFYSTLGISRCSRVCGQTRLHQAKHLWTPSTLWNRAAVIRSPTPSAMRSCTVSARIRTVSLLAGSALFHRSCILLVGAQSRSIRDSLLQMSPSSALLSSGQWSYPLNFG